MKRDFGLLTLDLPIRPFPKLNGNGKAAAAPAEQKSIPQINPALFWLDGNPNVTSWTSGSVSTFNAYQLAALAYICMHYRATKINEAPLMVVQETEDGEDWIRNHELDARLDEPNPDYGMPDLLERTQLFLDSTGRALWVKNRDRMGRVASLYAFDGNSFRSRPANGRLYGEFEVDTLAGTKTYAPKDVVLFPFFRPGDEQRGLAPLEVALQNLNISQELQSRVKSMLRNAAMPGGIYVLPADSKLEDSEFERVKAEIQAGFTAVNSGKSLLLEGGGQWTRTAFTLKELALGDLWRENEAMVCSCFGIPTALVGVVVGIENSPWSHLSLVKKNVDDDTIAPLRAKYEEALTRQLLREIDQDRTHLVRFDTSRIRALQLDQITKSQIAVNCRTIASLNERRRMVGLPKKDDPRADEVPELVNPNIGAAPSAPATPSADPEPRTDGGNS